MKNVLVAGMAAWVVRYLAFASMETPAIVAGLLLHGVSYGFVVTGSSIYAARVTPPSMSARAQSFVAVLVFGIGTFLGAQVAGFTGHHYQPRTIHATRQDGSGASRQVSTPLPEWRDVRNALAVSDPTAINLAHLEDTAGQRTIAIDRTGRTQYAKADLIAELRDADRDRDGLVTRADWQSIRLHRWPQIWSWAAALAALACLLFWIRGREPQPPAEEQH